MRDLNGNVVMLNLAIIILHQSKVYFITKFDFKILVIVPNNLLQYSSYKIFIKICIVIFSKVYNISTKTLSRC